MEERSGVGLGRMSPKGRNGRRHGVSAFKVATGQIRPLSYCKKKLVIRSYLSSEALFSFKAIFDWSWFKVGRSLGRRKPNLKGNTNMKLGSDQMGQSKGKNEGIAEEA
jgi:hypothetical protein